MTRAGWPRAFSGANTVTDDGMPLACTTLRMKVQLRLHLSKHMFDEAHLFVRPEPGQYRPRFGPLL